MHSNNVLIVVGTHSKKFPERINAHEIISEYFLLFDFSMSDLIYKNKTVW
jgi:hypothetical protein